MKRKSIFVLICLLALTGCMEKNKSSIMKDLANKIEKTKAYHLTGEMQIVNNEDKNLYDIDVSYQKDDQYRVSLKNKTNNHEQIILKNKDGVYVMTHKSTQLL